MKGEEGANEIDWDQYLDHYQLQGHTAPSNRGLADEEMPRLRGDAHQEDRPRRPPRLAAPPLELHAEEERVAMLIIGNLDEDGYFRMPAVEGEAEDAAPRNPLVRVALRPGSGLSSPSGC